MGSGPRLRTCVELVDHGVDAAGHAPATTDRDDGARAPFDPWPPSDHLDLGPADLTGAFAEAREA